MKLKFFFFFFLNFFLNMKNFFKIFFLFLNTRNIYIVYEPNFFEGIIFLLWYVLHSKYLSELNCSSDISYHYYSIVIYYSIHHLQDLVLVFKNHENFRDFENCNISLFNNLFILKFL